MQKNNVQLAEPSVLYKNTQANIEAIANPVEGMIAEATDTHRVLYYNGTNWIVFITHQTVYTFNGVAFVTSSPFRLYNFTGKPKTIYKVALAVSVAPTGSALIVDVNKGGTTIFTTQSNRPQIAASAFTGYSDTIEVSGWGVDEYLTVDIDQKGSTLPGENLVVQIISN